MNVCRCSQAEQAFMGVWREFAERLPGEDEADEGFPVKPEETAEQALEQLQTSAQHLRAAHLCQCCMLHTAVARIIRLDQGGIP